MTVESGTSEQGAVATKPQPKPKPLVHVTCSCSEDMALCGHVFSPDSVVVGGPSTCVVCADIENAPCPRCGSAAVWTS